MHIKDSPKVGDTGTKSTKINWMGVATLLIAVSALVTVLVVNMGTPSFVNDKKGYIQKVYAEEIHEYPADTSNDEASKGNSKGITVKNRAVFEEDVDLKKNLRCSATTELGTADVPLARLYVEELKGNEKGITVKNKTTFDQDVTVAKALVCNEDVTVAKNLVCNEDVTVAKTLVCNEDVTVAKNLVCSATSELGTEIVPLAKLYVREVFQKMKIEEVDSLKLSYPWEDYTVTGWEDQGFLRVNEIAKRPTDLPADYYSPTIKVDLPTKPVNGKLYTLIVISKDLCYVETTVNVYIAGDREQGNISGPITLYKTKANLPEGTHIQSFVSFDNLWYAM